jgi:hypothetical protein
MILNIIKFGGESNGKYGIFEDFLKIGVMKIL